jgi:hypothetical protein
MSDLFSSRTTAQKHPVNFNTLMRDVNAIRAATHRTEISQMPKGDIQKSENCPIARAIKNGIDVLVEADRIMLKQKGSKQHDWVAIAKALREAGFTRVSVFDNYGAKWNEKNSHYARPDRVEFKPTNTMANFIIRFDDGQFPDLIRGRK